MRFRPLKYAFPIILTAIFLGIAAIPAAAHKFGTTPLNDVKTAAANANRCSGLTASELASMVLAPTWPEVAPGTNLTPSPMALSRFDRDADLYSPWSNTPRAFFHPGIGAWQIDTAALSLAAFQKINTKTAAEFVAGYMAGRYCNVSGSDVARRRNAFSPWNACGSNQATCENLYQEHYCAGPDNVCQITADSSVGRLGGMKQRTCYYGSLPPSERVNFTCWFTSPSLAEGHTGSWQQSPFDGNSSLSPLAFAFYNFWDGNERRHWLQADTGYSRGEVFVRRPSGGNPRTTGVLNWTDADVLCDASFNKGTC